MTPARKRSDSKEEEEEERCTEEISSAIDEDDATAAPPSDDAVGEKALRQLPVARSRSRRMSQFSEDGRNSKKKEGTFVDAAAMKEKVRQKLSKPKYNVCDFYKTEGAWQALARDTTFEKLTLLVIGVNAIWIAVDTDLNNEEMLIHAHPVFQVMENLFCAFFGFEWFVRYMSFRKKLDGLMDTWFVFDGSMVLMMVLETWVFSLFVLVVAGADGSNIDIGILRMAKLMRLSRMCRMARLLRAMPELFVLLKGLFAAARSVFFTLVLLVGLLFIFAIAFKQLASTTNVGPLFFPDVPSSMYFLLVHGTLLLSADARAKTIGKEGGFHLNTLFFIFILLGAVLLMNMLIGVLCEVVSAVAVTEKEEMLVSYVGQKLTKVMALIDEDGGGTISRDEFMQILDNAEAMQALQDVGVDVIGLVDFADFIFGDDALGDQDDDGSEVELTMSEFMEVVLQLRGSNNATVKDIVDLRKFVRTSLSQTGRRLDGIETRMDKACVAVKDMHVMVKDMHTRRCASESFKRQTSWLKADGRQSSFTSGIDDLQQPHEKVEANCKIERTGSPGPPLPETALPVFMQGFWHTVDVPELRVYRSADGKPGDVDKVGNGYAGKEENIAESVGEPALLPVTPGRPLAATAPTTISGTQVEAPQRASPVTSRSRSPEVRLQAPERPAPVNVAVPEPEPPCLGLPGEGLGPGGAGTAALGNDIVPNEDSSYVCPSNGILEGEARGPPTVVGSPRLAALMRMSRSR